MKHLLLKVFFLLYMIVYVIYYLSIIPISIRQHAFFIEVSVLNETKGMVINKTKKREVGGIIMLKILSVEYEVAHQIISNLLQMGLISKAEFEAIDKENLKTFTKNN